MYGGAHVVGDSLLTIRECFDQSERTQVADDAKALGDGACSNLCRRRKE